MFWSAIAFAQTDSATVSRNPSACEIKLIDGSSYKGYIEKQNDSLIYLKGSSGVTILIPKKKVAAVDHIREHTQKDTINFTHLHSVSSIGKKYYVLSSRAELFKKHQLFISSNYFVLYHINYALNPHFSLGVSTSVIGAPLGIQAKANFELGPHFYLGVEGVAGGMMYLGPNTYATGGVVKLTFEKGGTHYTFFGGYADLEYWVQARRGRRGRPPRPGNYYLRYSTPLIGAAVSVPMNKRSNFTAEAFAFPNISIYTVSAAVRTMARAKVSFVFGLQVIGNTTVNVNKAYTLPYIGFSAGF